MQYLFGMHPVLEAIKAGKKFDKVMLKQGLEGSQFKELMDLMKENEIPFQFVPVERLNRAVRGAHQGVLAYISEIEYVDIEQLVNNALGQVENPLLVILDGVSDVRNLGAIARSLECAGGQGIIVPAKGGAAINADAVKAFTGLDSAENLEYVVYSEPMMSSIAYSLVLVKVKDGANVDSIAKAMNDNVDARKTYVRLNHSAGALFPVK